MLRPLPGGDLHAKPAFQIGPGVGNAQQDAGQPVGAERRQVFGGQRIGAAYGPPGHRLEHCSIAEVQRLAMPRVHTERQRLRLEVSPGQLF
jgi:hypothetical protein